MSRATAVDRPATLKPKPTNQHKNPWVNALSRPVKKYKRIRFIDPLTFKPAFHLRHKLPQGNVRHLKPKEQRALLTLSLRPEDVDQAGGWQMD